MFEYAVDQLKSTKFHKLAVREQKLWEIEKAARTVGESQEKIDELSQSIIFSNSSNVVRSFNP